MTGAHFGFRSLLQNAVFLSIADIAARGHSAVLALLIARFLGPTLYGHYATAASLAGLFMLSAGPGLEDVLTRRASRDPSALPKAYSLNVAIVLMLMFVVYAALAFFVLAAPYPTVVARLTLLTGLALCIGRFHLIFRHICIVWQETRLNAVIQGGTAILLVGATFVVLIKGAGLFAVVGLQLAAVSVGTVLWFTWVRSRRLRFILPSMSEARVFLHESIPFAISSMVWVAYFNFDTVMLSLMRSAEDVGVYASAYRIAGVSYIFGYSIANTFAPRLFRDHVAESKNFRTVGRSLIALQAVLGAVMAAGLAASAGLVVRWTVGDAFAGSVLIVQVLSLSVLFRMVSFALCEILTTSDRQGKRVVLESWALAANVLLNFLLIPRFGGLGAAVATVGAELILVVSAGWYVCRGGRW